MPIKRLPKIALAFEAFRLFSVNVGRQSSEQCDRKTLGVWNKEGCIAIAIFQCSEKDIGIA